ncbi:MAG: bifunctional phosphopantothenoylcysteine decarboxylase/phosphopantothenate--cysteine ligase CoaBC [Thermoplasmata archaeon]|nr:bifunctional phosphopantothenoylcysteine decarboxylase/phosphopantothenate--cysteine ligase CoaBC [Thermoplasmata archaeon]
MHPSRAIRGRRSQLLAGRRIILGISGSIAAIEVPRIARELIRHGADVRAVMSQEATRILTPEVVAFATGHPPITQLTGDVEHVTLLGPGEDQADLLLIAPATANTISKIAHGIDDTPVTSCASVALGGGVPILLAPAMHAHMGQNPALRENLERLGRWGVGVISSISAEGEEKIASPEEVAAAVLHRLARGPWAGRRVVVIGGASREPIDEVRSVTNESSGETAVALATQAHFRGADVELWAGALRVPIPPFLRTRHWTSVSDLVREIGRSAAMLRETDAVIVPAALADFTLRAHPGKIPSRDRARLELTLEKAPKILPRLRQAAPAPSLLVGFKLEAGVSAEVLEREARRLMQESGADVVVANDRATLGQPSTNALVVSSRNERHWLAGPKSEVASKLLDDLARSLPDRRLATRRAGLSGHRSARAAIRSSPRRSRRRSVAPRT